MNKRKRPILLIIVGAPGSGKTYLAERLFKNSNFLHVNSDNVRAQYFANPQFTPEERARVYIKIKELITNKLQSGRNVIFDGNLLTNSDRQEALHYYTKEIGAEVLFVFLDIAKDVAIKQAISRKSSDDNLYNEMPAERAIGMHETFQRINTSLPHITTTTLDDITAIELHIKSLLKF